MDNERVRRIVLEAAETGDARRKQATVEIISEILEEIVSVFCKDLSNIEAPFLAGVFGAMQKSMLDILEDKSEIRMSHIVERLAYEAIHPEHSQQKRYM